MSNLDSMLLSPEPFPCQPILAVSERRLNLPQNRIYDTYQRASDWTQARMFERLVQAAEAAASTD